MTLKLPDETKHVRIVHQLNGPVQHLQLRHVPSNWVIHSEGKGPDLAACVEALRRRAVRCWRKRRSMTGDTHRTYRSLR